MTELIDNLTQLLMALLGFVFSGTGYLKRRHRPLFLLSCFYGCFALGTLYWLLYTQLITDSPPISYVSDISWISCFSFCSCWNLTWQERVCVYTNAGPRGSRLQSKYR